MENITVEKLKLICFGVVGNYQLSKQSRRKQPSGLVLETADFP